MGLQYICIFSAVFTLTFLNFADGFSNAIQSFYRGTSIVSLHIRSDIVYRFATTTVQSTIRNVDIRDHESLFDVTLPDAAFITNFTLEIGGVVYPGVVKEKELARRQYDKAKKKGQSAGHISTKPRDTNRFKVTVNVAPRSQIRFVLTYSELLQRRRGSYDHTIYIRPKQVVDDFKVEVYIQESRQITYLRVPPLRDDVLTNYNSIEQNQHAVVSRPSSTTAYIRYQPSSDEQRLVSVQGLTGLFIVEYDVDRRLDVGDVLIVNGYFVHFFAPEGLSRMRRRILFILDTSGSMSGTKIEQLKDAMIQILDDLQEGDTFNIIRFNGDVGKWRQDVSAVPVTRQSIKSAKDYIARLRAQGWTNINSAVLEGIKDSAADGNDDRNVPIVIFLTDGEPTSGETDPVKILNNVKGQNRNAVPIFALSFGEKADFSFLKRLSAQNNGFARKIYEASDAALQLTGFYDEVSSVLVSNVTFQFLEDTVVKNSVTNAIFPNYFEGSELVVAGQLANNAISDIHMSVHGNTAAGPWEITSDTTANMYLSDQPSNSMARLTNFTATAEKIWAYITIKQILDERLRARNQTVRDELKKNATELALKYNFVTPLTSMVVTKPEAKDTVDPNDEESKKPDWGSALSGGAALAGKSPSFVDNDPHFIVHVKGLDTSVCFDVMGMPGDSIKLVDDHISGVTTTATIVANKSKNKKVKSRRKRKEDNKRVDGKELKTYIGSVNIWDRSTNLTFTPYNWTVNGNVHTWQRAEAISSSGTKVVTDATGQLIAIIFPNKITLLVIRHLRTKSQVRAGKVHFMGFYIVDDRGFSWYTHGLLGQFLHRRMSVERLRKSNGKTRGRLLVTGNTKKTRKLTATLGKRVNLGTRREIRCWMVQRNGRKLIDGKYTDYITRSHNSTQLRTKGLRPVI